MFEKIKDIETIVNESKFILPIAILFASILGGIVLSQLVFAKLRKVAVRVTDDSYPLVQRAFEGMPAIWGFLMGGYVAVNIITIPARGLHLLESLFNVIGILSLTIMGLGWYPAFLP